MQLFELLSLILLPLTWLAAVLFNPQKYKWSAFLPLAAVIACVLQIIFEGFIQQMLLVYLLSVLLLLYGVFRLRKQNPAAGKKRVWRAAGVVLVSVLVAAAIVIPIVFAAVPSPTGPYPVSSAVFEWIDDTRPETLTIEPDDYRDLLVKLWYPAEKSGAAAVSGEQNAYPVLIFSHGYGMNVDDYALELEDIASHGYIIFAINHPYEASLVVYPDGREVGMSMEIVASLQSGEQEAINALLTQYQSSGEATAKQALFMRIDDMSWEMAESSMNTWVADTLFVLDKAEALSNGSETFAGRLDLENVGVFGHSFGGSVAGMVCLRDQRFKSGINMDGMLYGQQATQAALQVPFMEMTSGDIAADLNDYTYKRSDTWVYRVHINGAGHNSFTDLALNTSLQSQAELYACGTINPYQMRKIVSSYTIAFFDTYLKNGDAELLKGDDTSMPEAQFRIYAYGD